MHARWQAKTLSDGVTLTSGAPIATTIAQLRALPRPPGVDGFSARRVASERQVYTVRAKLLRFTLATDGDIHLAIADPQHPKATMIAEIPDSLRMEGAPRQYVDEVARTRDAFIRTFGTPQLDAWREVQQTFVITGPIFFDFGHGQVGGRMGGAPNAIEIHPVLRMQFLSSAPKTGLTSAQSREVDRIALRALRRYEIPGLSLAVVRGGRIVYARGYGFSNVREQLPVTPQTQFQIGSVTKQFTAAIILQLAAERRLSLDDRVTRFFPFFRPAANVRIRDLLDQRSGIADYNSAWMLAAAAPYMFAGAVDREGLLRVVASRPLAFTPGTAFQYSNSNYLLLGVIAERATGEPLAQLFQTRIFTPARLSHTLLGSVQYCEDDAACGYSKMPFGVQPITPWRSDWTYSAGGITSTALDIAKWDVALMDGRILPRAQFSVMMQPHGSSGYGFGVFSYKDQSHSIVWHDGTVYGFKAMNTLILPERDAVVVLANADYAHAPEIAGEIATALFRIPEPADDRFDPSLPRLAFILATSFAVLPLLAMLILRRRYALGTVCVVLAYLGGIYFWPAGLVASLAGLMVVTIRAPALLA